MTQTSKDDEAKPTKVVSRRTFITGAVLAAAGGAALGVAGGYLAAPKTPSNLVLSIPTSWNQEADVVVIGSGGAGLAAAVGALESGASVIVLEKASAVGGTTAVSGGGMWVPNSSWQWRQVHQPRSHNPTFRSI